MANPLSRRSATKRFVLAVLGALALALPFRLGVICAQSSAIDCVEAVNIAAPGTFAVVVNGVLQLWRPGGLYEEYPPLPPGSPAAAIYLDPIGGPMVMLRNGRLYQWGPSASWELMRDIGCGMTAVESTTWGQIKHRAGQ